MNKGNIDQPQEVRIKEGSYLILVDIAFCNLAEIHHQSYSYSKDEK